MYCQKCRAPLKLDKSLEDLNPAAFDLLVGMHAHKDIAYHVLTGPGSTGKSLPDQSTSQQPSYPHERKELYDRSLANATSPIYRRTIPGPRHESTDPSHPGHFHSGPQIKPEMSFIEVTGSQIVPLPHATDSTVAAKGQNNGHIVDDVDEGDERSLSHEIERTEKLFSILSSHSDIDHPVCTECTNLLLSSMNARLASSTRERDAYVSFLKKLQSSNSTIPSEEEAVTAERELQEALEKEKAALEELKSLEAEKAELDAEIADLEEQSQTLEVEEEAFWVSRNAFDETLHELTSELSSLQQKHQHDQVQLQRLQRTNVYNDTFCISHDGHFGTINGLRLGRLPTRHVEWSEINAAWGQTLLLLATVAERLNYSFQGYRLRPIGSTSSIDKVEWPQQSPQASQVAQRDQRRPTTATPRITSLELFSTGDGLGRMFSHRKFDTAMVAFLDCLSQIGNFLERTSAAATSGERPSPSRTPSSRSSTSKQRILPYPIDGDMIGDAASGQAVSIKLGTGISQDDNWTKACKYALTCCKFVLAHVANTSTAKERWK